MKRLYAQRLLCWSLISMLMCVWLPSAQADPVTVRYVQGAFHGFLELRDPGGHVVTVGDATCVVHGDRVTAETLFRFKDGSVDDETAVFTQHRIYQLITDHHIQKGPFFPHPTDMFINVATGTVTVRSPGKDGKEQVETDHMKLPIDLVNGFLPLPIENLVPNGLQTTVSMVVLTPKPRVVKLVVSKLHDDNISVGGVPRKATHYEIKIDLGGIVGIVAPLVGKAPPNIQAWVIGGNPPTFARDIAPLYSEGPLMMVQLASPVWAEAEPVQAGK